MVATGEAIGQHLKIGKQQRRQRAFVFTESREAPQMDNCKACGEILEPWEVAGVCEGCGESEKKSPEQQSDC
jgi:ribosomal protein L32